MLKLVLDLRNFAGDVRVGWWKGANAGEGGRCFIPAILASEPARRLIAEPHRAKEEDGRKTLHDEWDDVLRIAFEVSVRAVVDPEGEHDTGSDEELIDTGQAAADGTRGVLRDWAKCWYESNTSLRLSTYCTMG